MDFLRDQGRPPDIRNIDLIQAMFSKSEHETECVLILETFVDQVDKETVLKNKDLPVNTVVGVLSATSFSSILLDKSVILYNPEDASAVCP